MLKGCAIYDLLLCDDLIGFSIHLSIGPCLFLLQFCLGAVVEKDVSFLLVLGIFLQLVKAYGAIKVRCKTQFVHSTDSDVLLIWGGGGGEGV